MTSKVQPLQNINPKHRWFSHMWRRIKNHLIWCCETTSLHGFHYMSNCNLSVFTRLFFACVGCCGFLLCSYLIAVQLLQRHQQSVLSTVKSSTFPVWQVRFPAVTICNFNIVYKNNIQNLMHVVKSRKINESIFMDVVNNLPSLIANRKLGNTSGYQTVFDELERGGYAVDRLMAELAHPCSNMIKHCVWQSRQIQCARIFESVRTNHGYCCSFNYYGTRNTSRKMSDRRRLRYQYAGGAGSTLGLRLVLDVEEEQYMPSNRSSSGFHILIHDGTDYPDMKLMANILHVAEALAISVTPRIYVGSDGLRGLDFKERHCLFEDEGNLEWSSIYSYKTCLNECKAKAIFQYCSCVPYYYPLEHTKRFCTLLDVPCLEKNNYKYSALGINDDFFTAEALQSIRDRVDNIVHCNCSAQCNKRIYDFHTDRTTAIQMAGFEFSNTSTLNVYYSTIGCVRTDREVYYTWDRVFATIGGLFGLCLGGSVISVLECFYFVGKFAPNCKKTKPKVAKARVPVRYVGCFANDIRGDKLRK